MGDLLYIQEKNVKKNEKYELRTLKILPNEWAGLIKIHFSDFC